MADDMADNDEVSKETMEEATNLVQDPPKAWKQSRPMERNPLSSNAKTRSMSVTVNPRFDLQRDNSGGGGDDDFMTLAASPSQDELRSPFGRSHSLQVPTFRPMIPTGNMLTEALMASAAEEREKERMRKKSISANIRYHLGAERSKKLDPAYLAFGSTVLILVIALVVLACLYAAQLDVIQQCSCCRTEDSNPAMPQEDS